MPESLYQYQIFIVAPLSIIPESDPPISVAEGIAQWMGVNLGEAHYHAGLGLQKFSAGGLAPPTHTRHSGTYTVAEATLLLQYLRGLGGIELPEGWEEMDKAARLAAADDDEDAALAASGVLSMLIDNAIDPPFDPDGEMSRIDTGGAPLEVYYPEE